MVTGQIRFALNAVHNQHFGFLARRRHQLHVRRETCTAQTYYTGRRDAVNNLFRLQRAFVHDIVSMVNTVCPNIAFYVDEDRRNTHTPTVNRGINLCNRTAERRVNICTHESAGFGNQLTYAHLVSFLDYRLRRCTDMLNERNNRFLRQRTIDYRLMGTKLLIIMRMHSA